MFYGKFEHKLNAKNQVTIPARFRELVPPDERRKGFYLVRGNKKCLFLCPHSEVVKIEERLREKSIPRDPRFRLMLSSRIRPVDADGQGRIVVPGDLKKEAKIKKEVVFVGNGGRIEIWAAERWRAFESEYEATYARRLAEMEEDLFEI